MDTYYILNFISFLFAIIALKYSLSSNSQSYIFNTNTSRSQQTFNMIVSLMINYI